MNSGTEDLQEILPDGMAVVESPIGFDPASLTNCGKCGRANPPNRSACMYCGSAMGGNAAISALDDELLESWQKGYNVVLSAETDSVAGEHADAIRAALQNGSSVPIGRFSSETKAAAVADELVRSGAVGQIVSDEELAADRPPVRARSVRFENEALYVTDFNTGETRRFASSDLKLIVAGVLFDDRTETFQKKTRAREAKAEKTQSVFDRPVVDIYFKGDSSGYRIMTAGFDFSSLGSRMSLIAGENLETLVEHLAEHCSGCRLDNNYKGLRHHLDEIWPLEEHTDHLGKMHRTIDRKGKTTVASRSNLRQFTKYSRLQARFSL
jgi:hypothetical protein